MLRLTSAVGFPIDVYVDPSTGAYKRIVIDPDGKYEEIYNGLAYTEVGGRHFLSAYYLYDDSKSVIRFDKIDVNVPVTPAELHPPKQTATWTFGEGTAAVELTKGVVAPRIFIDLVMNGVKGKFLLDTGAEGDSRRRFVCTANRGQAAYPIRDQRHWRDRQRKRVPSRHGRRRAIGASQPHRHQRTTRGVAE